MGGYTKLFSSLLASTVWREANETRIVWITLLAMAGENGVAEGSLPGIADFARVSIPEAEKALARLQEPDPYSRTQEHSGRRIQAVDGGWKIINHAKYRAKMDAASRKEYKRKKQAEYRERGQKCPPKSTNSTMSTSGQSGHNHNQNQKHIQNKLDQDLSQTADPATPKIEDLARSSSARAPVGENNHSKSTNLLNGSEQRRHGSHGWCSSSAGREGLCVPQFLHIQFMGKGNKSDAEMRVWYLGVVDGLRGQPVGEDELVFWRNNFAQWVGIASERPAQRTQASDKATRTMGAAERVIARQLAHRKALPNGTR